MTRASPHKWPLWFQVEAALSGYCTAYLGAPKCGSVFLGFSNKIVVFVDCQQRTVTYSDAIKVRHSEEYDLHRSNKDHILKWICNETVKLLPFDTISISSTTLYPYVFLLLWSGCWDTTPFYPPWQGQRSPPKLRRQHDAQVECRQSSSVSPLVWLSLSSCLAIVHLFLFEVQRQR